MKDNTFNVPAYNFSIMIINRTRMKMENRPDDYRRAMEANEVSLIPFDNVDGLTVEETLKTLQTKDFAICCSVNWKTQSGINQVQILDTTIFPAIALINSKNESIDQLVENNYENLYKEKPESIRRIYRCFFERYQDNGYQETVERIKKLTKSNK